MYSNLDHGFTKTKFSISPVNVKDIYDDKGVRRLFRYLVQTELKDCRSLGLEIKDKAGVDVFQHFGTSQLGSLWRVVCDQSRSQLDVGHLSFLPGRNLQNTTKINSITRLSPPMISSYNKMQGKGGNNSFQNPDCHEILFYAR